jgi:hypothetical protein
MSVDNSPYLQSQVEQIQAVATEIYNDIEPLVLYVSRSGRPLDIKIFPAPFMDGIMEKYIEIAKIIATDSDVSAITMSFVGMALHVHNEADRIAFEALEDKSEAMKSMNVSKQILLISQEKNYENAYISKGNFEGEIVKSWDILGSGECKQQGGGLGDLRFF